MLRPTRVAPPDMANSPGISPKELTKRTNSRWQVSHVATRRTLFFGLVLLFCGSLMLFLLAGQDNDKNAISESASMLTSPAAGLGEAPAAAISNPTNAGRLPATQHDSPVSGGQPLHQLLAGGSEEAWLMSYPKLMSLPAIELWALLERPEIHSQPRAKQLMQRLIMSCAKALAEFEYNASKDMLEPLVAVSQPLNSAWCEPLLGVPHDDRIARSRALNADRDVLAQSLRLPVLELMDSDAERAGLIKRSQQALERSRDPFLLNDAVRNLLAAESETLIPDLPAWHRLSKSQRHTVGLALQAIASCEALQSCGPQSLVTQEHCGWLAGFDCQNGMGLHQVVQNALSPNEMTVLNGILANIRHRRSAPRGS